MKKLILLALVVIGAFTACNKINSPAPHRDRLKAILFGTDTLEMYVGETRQVPLTLSPSDYHLDSLKWKSSDTTVLSFSNTGLLTAKKVGNSTITVSNLTNTISISALVTVKPAPVDSLKIGLLAYYPFNNNANDLSGNSNNGILYGVTSTTDRKGVANSAYYFDGATSYIRVPDAKALRLNNTDFSINIWVFLSQYNASYGSIVMDKRGAGSNNGWNFGVAGYGDLTNYINNYAIVTYSVSGGNDPYVAGNIKLDTIHWHMITTVYDASLQRASIYVDGKLDNIGNNIPSPNANSNADISIGADNPLNLDGYFLKGKIDDIRIYNRQLKDSEIQKLYTISN